MEKKESTEKSLLYQKSFSLTRAENEVLSMISDEFLTFKQIRIRRNCTKQAVYKIVKSLRSKGALTIVNQKGGSSQPSQPQRLHCQQFRIRIINKSGKYDEILKKANLIKIDENTIRLYKDIIEIYSGKSFFGVNEQEATEKSMDYWNHFIPKLENEFNVILQKPRSLNIKIVKQHYGEINSKLAEESEKSGEELKVYCKDDGKLSVIMDNSFNLHERECIHPDRSKQHSEAISKQVSCFIEDNPLTNSQLGILIGENAQQTAQISNLVLKDIPPILLGLKEQISSHLALIQEYRKENINWRKETYKKLKQQVKTGQTNLGDFE